MAYLVYSDIHNDKKAYTSLKSLSVFEESTKICLGDVINAHEDIDMDFFEEVSTDADTLLMGNHEAVLVNLCDITVFNQKVQPAITKNRYNFQKNSAAWVEKIQGLDGQLILDEVAFTHGSFDSENPWRHIRYTEDLNSESSYLPRKVNFLGHGHIPFIAWLENGLWYYERQIYNKTFTLNPAFTYIINCGSILGSREMREHEKTYVTLEANNMTVNFFNLV